MISAKIGHRYFIITTNIFFLRNLLSPWRISSSILSIPTTRDTSRLVTNAAIGIITEFVRKSNRSKNCIPRIFTNPSGPYPRLDNVTSPIIINPITTVDFFRPQPSSSSNVATALSVRAIELVRAANNTSRKNKIPTPVPSPIFANTFGIVINMSEGPACSVSGSPPENANTAGIIISPAMIAIAVSNTSTFRVAPSMDVSFFI